MIGSELFDDMSTSVIFLNNFPIFKGVYTPWYRHHTHYGSDFIICHNEHYMIE